MRSIIRTVGLAAVLLGLGPSNVLAQSFYARASGVVGFGERCAQRRVFCFSESDLKSRTSEPLSAILLRAGGISRRCEASTFQCVLTMKSGTRECSPTYFVDGVIFRTLPDDPIAELDRLIRPADVQGIEVYRSEQHVPAPFNSTSTCGSVLIWRKP
jgi:hypothetical protein